MAYWSKQDNLKKNSTMINILTCWVICLLLSLQFSAFHHKLVLHINRWYVLIFLYFNVIILVVLDFLAVIFIFSDLLSVTKQDDGHWWGGLTLTKSYCILSQDAVIIIIVSHPLQCELCISTSTKFTSLSPDQLK